LDWTAEEIRVVLLGQGFTYDPTAVYVSELPAADIIAVSDEVVNRSYEEALAAGDAAPFLQLLDNKTITHAVIYQDTGDPAYSLLIAHFNSDSITGAPKPAVGVDQFVYPPFPPGGFFQILDNELIGAINTYLLAGSVALAEISGGVTLVLPTLVLSTRLDIHTYVVCAGPDEPEDCCEPTIRSSICV
jgi:hypothetical protein